MTTPVLSRQVEGMGRVYLDPERPTGRYPSVTTVIATLSSPALANWKVRQVASAAVRHPGHLVALVAAHGQREAIRRLASVPDRIAGLAAARGDRVHNWAEAAATGVKPPELAEEDLGHVAAWHAFVEAWQPQIVVAEVTVLHRSLGYAGTADFLATLPDGRLVVGDYKTGGVHETAALQLAALANAEVMVGDAGVVPMVSVDGGLAVQLRADGSFRVWEPALGPAWEAFSALLAVWRWRHGRDPLGPPVVARSAS